MRIEYFQLIDRIIDIDLVGRTIRVAAEVPQTCTIFEGHFPGYPLMPGVLLIETMAQASGWLILAVTKFERMPFLAAVKEAKLRSFVVPGQTLAVSASLVHEGSGYAIAQAEISADGKSTSEAQITFRLMPFPDQSFRTNMEAVASAIEFPVEALRHG